MCTSFPRENVTLNDVHFRKTRESPTQLLHDFFKKDNKSNYHHVCTSFQIITQIPCDESLCLFGSVSFLFPWKYVCFDTSVRRVTLKNKNVQFLKRRLSLPLSLESELTLISFVRLLFMQIHILWTVSFYENLSHLIRLFSWKYVSFDKSLGIFFIYVSFLYLCLFALWWR